MDSDPSGTPADAELQFDRVESASAEAAPGSSGATCANCNSRIATSYFNIGNDPFCESCKNLIQAHIEPNKSVGAIGRALLLGFLAAIAGAIVYYGVIAITKWEIGIVAILIGYMVGWAVRKGASNRGGRRFQVLAVALTYFSVGLAYMPLALRSYTEDESSSAAQTDSTNAAAPSVKAATPADPAIATADSSASAATADAVDATTSTTIIGILAIIAFSFALPVLVIMGSMPSGLLSALIIAIGMRQAWQMTGVRRIQITGPFRVGPGATGEST
jgi:hypothetical protein